MKDLPENPIEAINLIIQLKPNVPLHTINNFGTKAYIFKLSDIEGITLDKRIRLYPIDLPNSVNILGSMLGYKRIRELFEITE